MGDMIRVLAVADPAVKAYVDKKSGILDGFGKKVVFDVFPWAEYYDTMMGVFAGKKDYDIIMVAGHLWLHDFVKEGYLKELHYDREDILPVIYEELKDDGKIYLSPSFCDGHIICYRKSILKEVLGELPKDVISPREYIDIAEKVYEHTGKPSLAMKAHSSEIFTDALPFLRMNGEDIYKDGEVNLKACTEGLREYCKLKKYAAVGTENYGNDEIAKAIREKEVPMATTWSGQMGVVIDGCVEKEDLGFTTFDTAWNVTWSFAISAGSRNEDAEEFLAYLRNLKIDKIAGKVSGAPVRESSYKDDGDSPWYSCQLRMFENAKPLPVMEKAGDKNGVLYEEIAKAFAGEISPEDALKKSYERIKNI